MHPALASQDGAPELLGGVKSGLCGGLHPALASQDRAPELLGWVEQFTSRPAQEWRFGQGYACTRLREREAESGLREVPLPLPAVLMDNRKGCAWPDRTSIRTKTQDRQQGQYPVLRRVRWAEHKTSIQTSCLPAVVAGHVRRTNKCARSSPSSVLIARTGTTPPPRTRRRPRVGLSSQSSAIPAASTRHTKRPNRAAFSSWLQGL